MKRSLLTLLCVMTAFGAQASDVAKVAPKGDAARGQLIVSTVCIACHGLDGNGPLPVNPKDGNNPLTVNPKLAGQHPEYLFKQMKNFKSADGKPPERVNVIMNAMIAAYDEGQMRDLAAYFTAQTRKGETAKNRETIELGQTLFRGGDKAKGLPACAACHGPAGAGIPGQYPRIGGQFAEYTEAQLKSFREGARANDLNKMMRMVAIKMTDTEIKAVSDYISGLR
jgi:cytochrome c553